jgi:hypothetical protein
MDGDESSALSTEDAHDFQSNESDRLVNSAIGFGIQQIGNCFVEEVPSLATGPALDRHAREGGRKPILWVLVTSVIGPFAIPLTWLTQLQP